MTVPQNMKQEYGHGSPTEKRIVYGTTVGVSALKLLPGQLEWLRRQGWDVKFVSTPDESSRLFAKREAVEFCPLQMTREISVISDAVGLFQWVRLLRRLNPDAVNVSTPKAGLLGSLAAWIVRVPRRLYVVRGLRLEGTRGLFRSLLWVMERLTMAAATDVVFVSRSLAREAYKQKLLPRRKSWLIGHGSSNGVNSSSILSRIDGQDIGSVRARLGLSPHDFVVGFIGRVTKDKGIETLLEAFNNKSLVQNARLLCVGAVEDAYLLGGLEKLGDKVRIIPWTDDVWSLLPALDVLALPTLREGFPNVVLEAAVAQVPTITTRATGAIDSVVHGKTGYVIDIDDADGLVQWINLLFSEPATAQKLGVAAKERAINDYKPEIIWQGISEILGDSQKKHAIRILPEAIQEV